jgi:hypothetical protein
MIDYQALQDGYMLNRAKTESVLSLLKEMKVTLLVEGESFFISHDGGEYDLIEKDPKRIGFIIEED